MHHWQAAAIWWSNEVRNSAKEQHDDGDVHIESEQFEQARKETSRTVSMKRYASRFVEAEGSSPGKPISNSPT